MIVTGPQLVARMRGLAAARRAASVRTLREALQILRTDIITNRLSKPRTGAGWVHVPGTGLKVRGRGGADRAVAARRALGLKDPRVQGRRWYTGVYRRSSGYPMYPQVLSVLTGHLRQSIYTNIIHSGNAVFGLIGSNVIYARAHEYRKGNRSQLGNRAFLRPSLRDNKERILTLARANDLRDVRVVWTSGREVEG